jgi:tRNA G18 (ribose-2'-O)-methylase SpoU
VPIAIDRADDPRIAEFTGLREHGRERAEWFVVEGVTAIQRLVTSPYPVRSLLATPARFDQLAPALAGVDAPVYVAPPEILGEVAGFRIHRGALASAGRLRGPALRDVLVTALRLVVLEGSNDHENIGAVARSARGLGVDALVLDPTCADPLYRRSVRVSMGELLHLPIVRCTTWPGSLAEMAAAGFETWALTPAEDAEDLFAIQPPARLALVAGAEGPGLSHAAQAVCTRRVRIPMQRGVDSLNVGHALAIAAAVTSMQ